MVSYTGAADALAGGVAMQRAVERHNRAARATGGSRCASASAPATRRSRTATGSARRSSRRRGCAARPTGGQILVSDLVRVLAGSRCEFEVDPLGTRELKGLPAPIAVCDVEWRVAARLDARSAARRSSTPRPAFPFAGRAEAFETLARSRGRRRSKARAARCSCRASPASARRGSSPSSCAHAHERGTIVLVGPLRRGARRAVRAVRRSAASLRRRACPPDRLRAELGPLGGELDAHRARPRRRAFPGSPRRCRPTPRPSGTGCSKP